MIGPKYPGCLGTRQRTVLHLHAYRLCRHDVGMQVVGQPARDLARHFVQRCVSQQAPSRHARANVAFIRWNHLLRIKVSAEHGEESMPLIRPLVEPHTRNAYVASAS